MKNILLNDEQLVILLQEGSKNAFEEIYKRYWLKLYNVAYHNLGTKEDSEELVQDIFENIWKIRESLNIQHLGVYLVVSVKHRCTNFIKKQINLKKFQEYMIFQEIQQNQSLDEIVNFNELNEAVEKALKKLPEKTGDIFKKSRFENQSIKEIATHFQLTEKAVEYHITKSLKALKEELKLYSN